MGYWCYKEVIIISISFYDWCIENKPELLKEWDYEENDKLGITPKNITYSSEKKVWWICEKSHKYERAVYSKIKGHGCPYCNNRKVLTGFNDLATKCPHIAKQWHPTKNDDLTTKNILYNSSKKVWWICDNKHEWEAPICNRTGQLHSGCPYCANKKVLTGYNDLATTHPELAKEWHPTKNGNLKPTDITYGTNQKVWWMCKKGHEWKATIASRANGNGCAKCSSAGASQREKLFLFYILKYGNEKVIHKYRKLGFELDIYIPSLKIGIEYDGSRFHENVEKDIIKNKKCAENGIKLFRIRERPLQPLNDTSIDICYSYHNDTDLKKAVHYLIKSIFRKDIEINTKENSIEFNECINLFEKENSLIKTHPDIAKQWHPTKNGTLKPENFTYGSPTLIWWRCEKCHEWQATIHNRTTGRGCPYCAGKKVWVGFNDLATTHPELAKLWHPTLNGNLKPTDVTINSYKEVWWICDKGHEYRCKVINRKQKDGRVSLLCPYCINKRILIGYNDLSTTYPEIAKQWHPIKNGDLKPTDVTAGSDKKVWWICEKGHIWQSRVGERTRGNGCPYCSNQKVLVGYNDLTTTHPHIAKEFHPTKNINLTAKDIVAGSNKKVWWLNKDGKEVYTSPYKRIKRYKKHNTKPSP